MCLELRKKGRATKGRKTRVPWTGRFVFHLSSSFEIPQAKWLHKCKVAVPTISFMIPIVPVIGALQCYKSSSILLRWLLAQDLRRWPMHRRWWKRKTIVYKQGARPMLDSNSNSKDDGEGELPPETEGTMRRWLDAFVAGEDLGLVSWSRVCGGG